MEILALLILCGIGVFSYKELKKIEKEEMRLEKRRKEMYERAKEQGQQ